MEYGSCSADRLGKSSRAVGYIFNLHRTDINSVTGVLS